MQDEDFFVGRLQKRCIKPTATRLLILRQMFLGNETVSLPYLEHHLPTIDKSTISRTLTLFLQQGLLHTIDDGSGTMKYALSDDDTTDLHQDEHTHFYCTQCQRTFCLKKIHVPVVELPAGFISENINYVIKGLCPECNLKNARRI